MLGMIHYATVFILLVDHQFLSRSDGLVNILSQNSGVTNEGPYNHVMGLGGQAKEFHCIQHKRTA
jgi:hypothetical protein